MIGLAEILIVFGVLTLAGTYLLIVRSFIRNGERENSPTGPVPATDSTEYGHITPANERPLRA